MVRVYESMWRMFATAAVLAVLALTTVAPPSTASKDAPGGIFCAPGDNDPTVCFSGLCLPTYSCQTLSRPTSGGDWECCY